MKTAAVIISILLGLWLLYGPLPTLYLKYLRRRRLPQQLGQALLLSFDDGPDPLYTPQLIQTLARYEVKALFFLIGRQMEQHPQLVQELRRQGHSLGWHGPEHHNMWLMGYSATKKALAASAALTTGQPGPAWYRPPYGNVNLFTLLLARKYGLRLLLWTTMIQDWRLTPDHILVERLLSRSGPGSVICLHDCGEGSSAEPGAPAHTIAALEMFIPAIQAQGYRFIDPQTLC